MTAPAGMTTAFHVDDRSDRARTTTKRSPKRRWLRRALYPKMRKRSTTSSGTARTAAAKSVRSISETAPPARPTALASTDGRGHARPETLVHAVRGVRAVERVEVDPRGASLEELAALAERPRQADRLHRVVVARGLDPVPERLGHAGAAPGEHAFRRQLRGHRDGHH